MNKGIWTSSYIPLIKLQSYCNEPEVRYCTIELTIVTVVELSPNLSIDLRAVSAFYEKAI